MVLRLAFAAVAAVADVLLLGDWGGADDGERWDTYASYLGGLVLGECPRLLLVVEGVAGCVEDEWGGCAPAVEGVTPLDGVGTCAPHASVDASVHGHLVHLHALPPVHLWLAPPALSDAYL